MKWMTMVLLVLAASLAVADPYAAWRQKEEAAWHAALTGPCGKPMREALAAEGRVVRAASEMANLFHACFEPRSSPCDRTPEHDAKHRCREQVKAACMAEPPIAAAKRTLDRLEEKASGLKAAYQRCSGTPLPETLCSSQYDDPEARCVSPDNGG